MNDAERQLRDRQLTPAEVSLFIKQAAERLRREFDGMFNTETIEHYIANSKEMLDRDAKFTRWLPVLVERLTRDRLRALARLEVGELDRPAVLFLCVHNAGRSQMAAGYLRSLVGDGVDVFSGGTDPGVELNAHAVAVMSEIGIDIAGELPQPWTDEIARAADVIVSMGCGDACPIYPGKRYEEWDLDLRSDDDLDAVRAVRDDIRGRVERLISTLELDAQSVAAG